MIRKNIALIMVAATFAQALPYEEARVYAENQFTVTNGILTSVSKNLKGEITIPTNVTKIDSYVFCECNNITKINIPSSVKTIGEANFKDCDNLKEIDMQEGVTYIGDNFGTGSNKLEKVTIPKTVTYIGYNAFSYCANLNNVIIKTKNTEVGQYAFNETPWFNNLKKEDGMIISGSLLFDGEDAEGDITIPSEVTSIRAHAFDGNNSITNVNFNNVKIIGENAFFSCNELKDVKFTDKLENIGRNAFSASPKLNEVELPDSIKNIDPEAFNDGIKITGNAAVYTKSKDDAIKKQKQEAIWEDSGISAGERRRGYIGWNDDAAGHHRFYKNADGTVQTGWMDLNGNRYYFYSNYKVATGFVDLNGTKYYLDPSNNTLKYGWQKISSKWYYFSPTAEGSKVKGFMKTSWLYNGGNWYYMYSNGQMATGFINLNGAYYYLNNSGAMTTGWQKINGKWYYFNKKSDGKVTGMMRKGWNRINGVWYYFYPSNGQMAANTWVGGYHLNASGAWDR